MNDVTQILRRIEQGEPEASSQLLPVVYDELRRLAAQRLRHEPPGQTLEATALVHEVFIRLVDRQQQQHWSSRGHFFAAAAEAMRRILVENARRKHRVKRGGGLVRHKLDEGAIDAPEIKHDLLALDEALDELARKDHTKYQLVQLRFFAGLTIEQAAQAMGISTTTADRYWTYARAWLFRRMAGGQKDPRA